MRIPRKVYLNGLPYKVKLVEKIDPKQVEDVADDEMVVGAFDWWKATIELLDNIPKHRQAVAFLHECIHGISEDIALKEDDIDKLAWRLHDLIARNRLMF